MFSVRVAVFFIVLGCCWGSSLARAAHTPSRLEAPCSVNVTNNLNISDNVSTEEYLRMLYDNLLTDVEQAVDIVTQLKTDYFYARDVEEGDLRDLIIFILRHLPDANPVTMEDLVEADPVVVSHDLFRQLAHASRILQQGKLDELNLEANGGFSMRFRSMEDRVYSLLCELKGVLLQHNEDIQHSVVEEVLSLPMHTPNTRAKRIVRDCLILHYLQTVMNNAQQYFSYFLENV